MWPPILVAGPIRAAAVTARHDAPVAFRYITAHRRQRGAKRVAGLFRDTV
jgi:hypothetical protein